jgi:hypothetical protein
MRAYKAFDKDLKSNGRQYEIGKSYHQDLDADCIYTLLYACVNMNDCYNHYPMDSRICEIELFGTIKEEVAKHCASDIKIIRELNEDEIISKLNSEWAYHYCRDFKDRKEIRDRITDSYWAYHYCRDVKDRKKIRGRITESEWAYHYCRDVKNRKKVRARIKDKKWKKESEK